MIHKHKVYDTDPCFSINPYTRFIKNETNTKITLIQHDHNSERFTFEIPRFIEEHDMSLCNVVQVHYINIESGNRNQNEDVYDITDLHIDPDDNDKVICSWLISGNATKYVGSLNFVVRFSCVTEGVIEYAWNTAVFSGISVSSGIFNTNVIAEKYSDILAQWTARIEALEQGGSGGSSSNTGSTAEPIELSDNDILPLVNINSFFLCDQNNKIPIGVEIVKIEGSWDGETWFDFKRLIEIEPANPYYIANTHSFYSENDGMHCIMVVAYDTEYVPTWVSRIEAFELNKVRVTYKTEN